MNSYVTHLASALDGTHFDAGQVHTVHQGRPLWVRYDLAAIRRAITPETFTSRPATMWRYRELLPLPLDAEEWKVMKEHPVISEYILSEIELPETVLQIARSSHERMDGGGYPDGLAGLPWVVNSVYRGYSSRTSRGCRPVASRVGV